jgi:hypothetical protein
VTSGERLLPTFSRLSAVGCLLLALDRPAGAYTDPGSGAMVWQLAAASMIGTLFYVRRVVVWLRSQGENRVRAYSGFLFATLYGGIASLIAFNVFAAHPLPRFGDIFLIGVVLTAYLFSWQPALYLYLSSLVVTIYVLPPFRHFRIAQYDDLYRVISYSVCCLFLIWIVERRRANRAPVRNEAAMEMTAGASQQAG